MCSPKELRLSEDAEGLLILPGGQRSARRSQASYPAIRSSIWRSHPTAGLAFALGHRLRNRGADPRQNEANPVGERSGLDGGENIAVEIAPGPRVYYTARMVRGVRLHQVRTGCGRKWNHSVFARSTTSSTSPTTSCSSVGQPLHAFDGAKLHGGRIRVRMAKAGEEFIALDGNSYRLAPEDIVIADADRVVALAGIMGGAESGITDATTDIVLESAWFNPASIRRTSRRLGLSSESSYRFERGVDPITARMAVRLRRSFARRHRESGNGAQKERRDER